MSFKNRLATLGKATTQFRFWVAFGVSIFLIFILALFISQGLEEKHRELKKYSYRTCEDNEDCEGENCDHSNKKCYKIEKWYGRDWKMVIILSLFILFIFLGMIAMYYWTFKIVEKNNEYAALKGTTTLGTAAAHGFNKVLDAFLDRD